MNHKAFTLIEILIFFSVGTIVGVLLVAVLTQSNKLFLNQSTKVSQGISLNDANSQIGETIRSAALVAPSYTDNGTIYTTGSSTIVLKTPSIDSSGSSISNTYDYLVITKDNTNSRFLKKLTFPDTVSSRSPENKILSNMLLLLQFTYLDDGGGEVTPTLATRINYTINLQEQLGVNSQQSSASGQVNLRNN